MPDEASVLRQTRIRARARIVQQRHWVYPVLLLAPAIGIILVVVILPLVSAARLSLTNYSLALPTKEFIGFDNYIRAFSDSRFRNSLWVTLIFSTASTTLSFVLGFAGAHLLTRQFRGRRIVSLVLMMPMMITPIVVGIVWLLMFQPGFSVINGLLSWVGIDGPIWLQSPGTSLLAVIIADVWQWTPLFVLVLLAGLLNVPESLYDAANVDGASATQKFRYVTLPLMSPLIVVVLLVRFIDAFKSFDAVFVMTNGGPGASTELLSLFIWRAGIPFFELGYAAAMSFLFLIILTLLATVLIRVVERVI